MNKEEIEERITYAKSKFWEIKHREPIEGIEILLEIIQQLENKVKELEANRQAVIEKCKEDIKIYSREGCCRKQVREGIVREAQEILNMSEGEKNE